jgi:hypothetical protein
MARIQATASAVIDAPAPAVYGLLADYRNGHPRILRERYFSGLEVERGGTGAGTVIRFRMHALGATRAMRAEISEPEPGRTLVETYLGSGEVTTFTVEPLDGGGRCRVTILTEWTPRGFAGLVQRLLVPPLLRRIYAEELGNLARCAGRPAGSGTSA